MGSNANELADSQLIQNFSKPMHAWICFISILIVIGLFFNIANRGFLKQHNLQEKNPFLQVTNREFSQFLWQFPEYMRVNVSFKSGYLPGFQYNNRIGIKHGQADDYVSAPPEVLFLYHVWKSLIGDIFIPRKIKAGEFVHFLNYNPEWHPKKWPEAPASYHMIIDLIKSKDINVKVEGLPIEVQKAFIGWKNFFMEGDLINSIHPTYDEINLFLEKFPGYRRNYWRNILIKGRPNYLKSFFLREFIPNTVVPESELAAFLKVAYFNFIQD